MSERALHVKIRVRTTRFIGTAVDRLYQLIEATSPLATDGGQLGNDIYGSLPGLDWNHLVASFLAKP